MEASHKDTGDEPLPAIPAKRYFTIGEVSELCGVKPHVLRYWEQEFSQLRPVTVSYTHLDVYKRQSRLRPWSRASRCGHPRGSGSCRTGDAGWRWLPWRSAREWPGGPWHS